MKRFLLTIALILIAVSALATYTYMNPIGPTLIPVARMITDSDDNGVIGGFQIAYWKTVDEAISSVVSGKADIILLPVVIGAQLYAKGVPIKLAAVSMWDGFYFVSKEKISSIEDLSGKAVYTLHAPGQTADVILKAAIDSAGLDRNSISILYAAGPEAIQLFAAGRADVLLVPEPFASLAGFKVPGAEKYLPIQEIWRMVSTGSANVPTSGIFVKEGLPVDVVDSFLLLYEQSLLLSLAHPEETAKVVSEKMGGFPVAVLLDAIPGIRFEFGRSDRVKGSVKDYLDTLKNIESELLDREIDFEKLFW
ncbi:nitrate ABC transporter substrate-binding protein [Kosmotoga arenicorallina S304]|uniref:Nitrate ABC transporter substrate-binding protein n=1 Tax=Kosmotoga arenicorallina S304 TaxID=1453497 RepID=A0A182C785_9BACT|nr:ABC transporter substrate-binding protein [Kosmotoga arenicorallina]OAA31334.1 nitrate ABC transporter substrate-binding protein [Kosmotoga arenicorallina S304]